MSGDMERTPRPAIWKDVPNEEWDDWKWQLSHRLNTIDELAQVVQLRDEETAALKAMLPWLTAHVEELGRSMGSDWWPYGFEPNRHVMETFLRYHYEQGLSKRRLRPEELFAPETMAAYKI